MKDIEKKTCRIALVQAEPVMFDKAASLDKALGLIKEAAAGGATPASTGVGRLLRRQRPPPLLSLHAKSCSLCPDLTEAALR